MVFRVFEFYVKKDGRLKIKELSIQFRKHFKKRELKKKGKRNEDKEVTKLETEDSTEAQ